MFSGIVEEAAQVVALQSDKGNLHLTMKCSFVNELKIDQSVAHNGVCLTVVSMTEYSVDHNRFVTPIFPPEHLSCDVSGILAGQKVKAVIESETEI